MARFIAALSLRSIVRVRMSDPLMSIRGVDEDIGLSEEVSQALLERDKQRVIQALHNYIAESKERILDQLMHPTGSLRRR